MMGASKTRHGVAVLLCLILMYTSPNQVESSTTDGPATADSPTTPLPTDLPTTTTTTTTTPETIAPTGSSEPNPPKSTLDGTSTAASPSSTTTDTTTPEAATTGQPASAEPTSSTIAPTPTTSPTTTSSSSGSTTPPASSVVTSLQSSPGAEPQSTAESAGPGTIAVSSTTVSTESSASPEGSGSATSTPESSVSVLTSAPPSPTATSSATVTVTTTTTTPTPTTTTAAATTTAKHAYPTKKPEKPFRLDFEVGDSNATTVYCTDNCTFKTILEDVQRAFSDVPGYLYVASGDGATHRRRRDTRFSVAVLFNPGVMVSLSAEDRAEAVYMGFQNLDRSSSVQVQLDQVNDTIVAGFVERTADMCKVPNTCPSGYRCGQGVCYHLCENHDCSSNGVCQAVVDTDGSSRATCVCNSGYEHTYSGAHCENEETSDAKKAAIVGGVLGTFCAIFLILILFLYCRLRESDGGSKRNYQLGGYSNNGYADQEFAMRNPASDDP